jgi:hypothetical protein
VVPFPVEEGIFLIVRHVQAISGAHPASYSAGTRVVIPERKSGCGLKQIAYPSLMLRLRMSGILPLLFINVFFGE